MSLAIRLEYVPFSDLQCLSYAAFLPPSFSFSLFSTSVIESSSPSSFIFLSLHSFSCRLPSMSVFSTSLSFVWLFFFSLSLFGFGSMGITKTFHDSTELWSHLLSFPFFTWLFIVLRYLFRNQIGLGCSPLRPYSPTFLLDDKMIQSYSSIWFGIKKILVEKLGGKRIIAGRLGAKTERGGLAGTVALNMQIYTVYCICSLSTG